MGVGWRGDKKIPESVTIPLTKGEPFGGIVHDEQGHPVEGAQVTGEMVFENRHGFVRDGKVLPFLDGELAKTDKEGRWQCSMAPEGDIRLELSFSHPAFVSDLFNNCDGKWDGLRSMKQVVVLERGMVLTGNVVDTNGKPVANVIVEAMSNVDGQRRGSQVVSDHEGKFTSHPIPIGKASLSVVAAGFAPYMREIEFSQSAEPTILRLDEGRPIRIQLVDASGEPITGAQVSAKDLPYPGHTTFVGEQQETSEQGIWEWPHAPEGETKYLIYHPEYMETEFNLAASNQLQKVTLEPRVKVTGNVIDKDTRIPIEKFKVTQLLWIDCGQTEGKDCLVVRDSNVVQDSGDYTFESGARCKQFKMLCQAEGYKEIGSRIMHNDEREITCNFELERRTEKAVDTP